MREQRSGEHSGYQDRIFLTWLGILFVEYLFETLQRRSD